MSLEVIPEQQRYRCDRCGEVITDPGHRAEFTVKKLVPKGHNGAKFDLCLPCYTKLGVWRMERPLDAVDEILTEVPLPGDRTTKLHGLLNVFKERYVSTMSPRPQGGNGD